MNIYQKFVSVIWMLRSSIAQKAGILSFATKFTTSKRYLPGRLTVYNDVLYLCTVEHYGDWDESHFLAATADEAISLKASKDDLAPGFDVEGNYSPGDVVVKDGRLVECTGAGIGSSASFSGVTVVELIKRLDEEISSLSDNASSARSAQTAKSMVNIESIAPAWVPMKEYKPGFMVSRNGMLYCCIDECRDSDWDASKWTETTVADVIEGLTSAMTQAIRKVSG